MIHSGHSGGFRADRRASYLSGGRLGLGLFDIQDSVHHFVEKKAHKMNNESRMSSTSGVKNLFGDESYQMAGEHSETEDCLWVFCCFKCSGGMRVMTSN